MRRLVLVLEFVLLGVVGVAVPALLVSALAPKGWGGEAQIALVLGVWFIEWLIWVAHKRTVDDAVFKAHQEGRDLAEAEYRRGREDGALVGRDD